MAKKEFQAESKKLMDMMINSIYTNKEIFLRELISNASDAIDKLYYKSLTDTSVGMNKSDFRILLTRDKENRILTVEDNGIGMTKEELEQNLGTIAHSGSLDFKKDNKDDGIDIILLQHPLDREGDLEDAGDLDLLDDLHTEELGLGFRALDHEHRDLVVEFRSHQSDLVLLHVVTCILRVPHRRSPV